jgi:hypothetical protein
MHSTKDNAGQGLRRCGRHLLDRSGAWPARQRIRRIRRRGWRSSAAAMRAAAGATARAAEDMRSPSLLTSVLLRRHTQRSHDDAARGERQDAARDAAEQKSAGRSALPTAADDDHFGAVFSGDVQNLLPRRPTPDQRLDVDPAAHRARCANLLGELFQ